MPSRVTPRKASSIPRRFVIPSVAEFVHVLLGVDTFPDLLAQAAKLHQAMLRLPGGCHALCCQLPGDECQKLQPLLLWQ